MILLCVVMIYLTGYYMFITKSCLEVSECFSNLIRGMINLPTSSWLEFTLFIVTIMIIFTLFLGLIVDSISEYRAHRQNVEDILNNRCFICDLSKTDFENAKLDF